MTQTKITIRPATKDDIHHIEALIQAIAAYEKLSHEVVATRENLLKYGFSDDPSQNVYKCLLAEHNAHVVGFALYYLTFSTFVGQPGLYLEDIFVQPEARGLGAGKLLFNALAQLVVKNGYGRFEWQVLDWNQPAIDFYEKHIGAKRHNGWHHYRMSQDEVKLYCRRLA